MKLVVSDGKRSYNSPLSSLKPSSRHRHHRLSSVYTQYGHIDNIGIITIVRVLNILLSLHKWCSLSKKNQIKEN